MFTDVASVLSKYQTIFLVQIMFNICEIIIEKNVLDAVPHRDIDLTSNKSEIINNNKNLLTLKLF